MKRVSSILAVSLLLLSIAVVSSVAGDYSYIGATKCKMCHNSKKMGEQYKIWSESGHSKAYLTLAGEAAKKVAEGMGIEDAQKSEKCLKCHAPSYGAKAELKGKKWNIEEGVSCEDCHGPGSGYQKMSVMKAIAAGKEKPEAYGLLLPDEKACKGCHNEESPTYDKNKPFVFKEMYKKIAHLKPEPQK